MDKPIRSALISVFHKDGLEPVIRRMHELGIRLISTGGTQQYISSLGIPVVPVESLTGFPEMLGGRVKTLHPGVFGGILARRSEAADREQLASHGLEEIDCVVVDLYPFEETVAAGAPEDEIIEKIDIGGISLIRAAAKNHRDVVIISSREQYPALLGILSGGARTTSEVRRKLAREAFDQSSHYDAQIYNWFLGKDEGSLKVSVRRSMPLRYGENPHQRGRFYGALDEMVEQLGGKELSYNNLLDADAAILLMDEFRNEAPTFAILKHNNACGCATRATIREAYEAALAADPISAFGGVLISNTRIDAATAQLIHALFCEVVIAPDFEEEAENLLRSRPNRILLKRKEAELHGTQARTLLNGWIWQDRDSRTESPADMRCVTSREATPGEVRDLIFAERICKHTRSNAIVLARDGALCAGGTGQTSRVDALRQAIAKAASFGIPLEGSVMASDAFFPFPDCVEIAWEAGIRAVIQPGGSVKDQLSVDFCNAHGIAMYMTGVRHFRH